MCSDLLCTHFCAASLGDLAILTRAAHYFIGSDLCLSDLTTLVWLYYRGVLERSEPVPFRLTRNLQTFFTPFGVEGVFITAMAVAAQVGTPCSAHVP